MHKSRLAETICVSLLKKKTDCHNYLLGFKTSLLIRYAICYAGSAGKARGHLGKEILNKASAVIQIGFDKTHSPY